MPSINLSLLKGFYNLHYTLSSIPDFVPPKPFGYLFEFAELALNVGETGVKRDTVSKGTVGRIILDVNKII
jgi:hypothetical protein